MELGKRIKQYRNEKSLSQDILAEKVYVSRQTISNWENEKSYPDVHSLVLLSKVLDVSLDQLIKGDVKLMKELIYEEDQRRFGVLSNLFAVMMIATAVTPIPLVHFFSNVGIGVWVAILGVTIYLAICVEREKKKFDMQTYKEIVAFMEGTGLDEIEKAKEEGKRPYQKVLLAIVSGIITLVIAVLFIWLLKVN